MKNFWDKIINDYPQSVRKLVLGFLETNDADDELTFYSDTNNNLHITSTNTLLGKDTFACIIYFRDLYDFFDAHEIYITIDMHINRLTDKLRADWVIESDSIHRFGSTFDVRSEAEIDAFKTAFEILEKILSRN